MRTITSTQGAIMPNVKTLFWNAVWTWIAITIVAGLTGYFKELGRYLVNRKK